jgi:hypothetical protein
VTTAVEVVELIGMEAKVAIGREMEGNDAWNCQAIEQPGSGL